jgi:tyrosyl-tRNA synthetase
VIEVPRTQLEQGQAAINLFHQAGLAASVGEVRRLFRGSGARINDKPVSDEKRMLTVADLNSDGVIKLSAGRKRHALIKAI